MKIETWRKAIAFLIISLFFVETAQIGLAMSLKKTEIVPEDNETRTSFNPFSMGWLYRRQITIDHTKVASDLTDFPVFISISNSHLQKKAQSDGDDILFMDGIGKAQQLNHEIELYDGSTGNLFAWVNIPSVSSTEDTVFYMYYGNKFCDNQQHVEDTWNSNFTAVWHMNDATSITITDSTSGAHTGTKESIDHPIETSYGKIAQAQNFMQADAITSADSDDFSMTDGNVDLPFSIELWMYPTVIDNHHILLGKDGQGRNEWIFQYYGYQNYPRFISIMLQDSSSYVHLYAKYYYNFQPNIWYHFAVTYDGSATLQGLTLYFNGEPVTWTETIDTGYTKMHNTNAPLFMGKFDWSDPKYYYGILDEVRISKGIARSEGWISTEFNNQNNPSSFYSVKTEVILQPSIQPQKPYEGLLFFESLCERFPNAFPILRQLLEY